MNAPSLLRGVTVALLFALVALAGAAHAADAVVGKVLAVRGEVVAEAGRERVRLTVDMQVRATFVIVAANGKAKIELVDGSIVSVGENSRVRIADVAAPAAPATRVELLSGALRLLVVKATPGARFEVETETAVAAVRGTDWAIEATHDNTGVVVLTGSVEVRSRDAAAVGAVLLDQPGTGTDVRRGSAPTPPARWGEARRSALLARTSLQ